MSADEDPNAATKKIGQIADIPIEDNDLHSAKHIKYNNREPVIVATSVNTEKKTRVRKGVETKTYTSCKTHMYGYS